MDHERFLAWIAHVEAVQPEMDRLAKELENYGATVAPDEIRLQLVGSLPYITEFYFPTQDATTNVYILLKDHQTTSDVVITHITTLPKEKSGQGCGGRAIQLLLQWAADNNLNEVRATQVSTKENELFWQKNGFKKCPLPNPCNDFVHIIPKPQPTYPT